MKRMTLACALAGACMAVGGTTSAAAAYNPIVPTQAERTITLDGKSMTIEEVVAIARYGAKVRLAPSAKKRTNDAYELLLQGAKQGIPIYWFNRAPGSGRETVIFEGDPLSPENKALLSSRQLATFKRGPSQGAGPEVADEEIVRAMMAVRANTMVYEAASPQLTQMLLDLLNQWISPVVQSRGSPGEGDLPMMSNVGGTMVGAGQAYYHGEKVSAGRGARARRPAAAGPVRGRRRGADEHERLLRGAGGAARARRQADARLVGPDVLDEHAGPELERHAAGGRAAGGPPVPVPELAGEAAARPDQGQLPVRPGARQRRQADHPGPAELPRLQPAQRRRVAGVGSAEEEHGDPDQLVGSQPGGRARRQAERLVGAQHAVAEAVLRQQRRQEGLHHVELQLRRPPVGERPGGLHDRPRAEHRRLRAARHAVPGHVLHGDLAVGRARGRRPLQGGAAGARATRSPT